MLINSRKILSGGYATLYRNNVKGVGFQYEVVRFTDEGKQDHSEVFSTIAAAKAYRQTLR
jgi:hypothetical protein